MSATPPPGGDGESADPASVVVALEPLSRRPSVSPRAHSRGNPRRCTVTPLFERATGDAPSDPIDRTDDAVGPQAPAENLGEGLLSLYVVYDHPADYPTEFAVRRWCDRNGPDKGPCMRGRDIWEIRTWLREDMKLVRVMPDERDDPVILEIWI